MSKEAAKILLDDRTRLVSRCFSGKGNDYVHRNAELLDEYFFSSFARSLAGQRLGIGKNPYAIVALGGYGRMEQCLHSDVDLLFLFKNKVPQEAEDLFKDIVYPLWDIGLEVGHSVRSIKDCTRLAADDYEILTAMLDGRFVCGMSNLYMEMMEKVAAVARKKKRDIIRWFIDKSRARHERFGDSTYRLEPNLKEGQGGLRDYHSLLWIARVDSGVKESAGLKYEGYLSHNEYADLTNALKFIWNVRSRLHRLAGRKCDQLHFDYQEDLAKEMHFKKSRGQQPVERFLGELHEQMECLKIHHQTINTESERTGKVRLKSKFKRNTRVEGLVVKEGMLGFASLEVILKTPALLIKIFRESADLKLPLSAEAKRIISDFDHHIDEGFRTSREIVTLFERVLSAPSSKFNVLNDMLSTGFLEKFIPEFTSIRNRIQYNQYHIFPVDKHSLKTVDTLKRLATEGSGRCGKLCAEIYAELKNKKILLWSALLHDIGKGVADEGGHSESGAIVASDIILRMGYDKSSAGTIKFLVKNHLFLVKIATRRDTKDEETAIFCARHIRDADRLKMLYMLTVADSMATGPKAWNDWTAHLLRDLFLKVLNVLMRGELATPEAMEVVAKRKEALLAFAGSDADREHLSSVLTRMSPRYILGTSAGDMMDHISMFHKLKKNSVVWDVKGTARPDTRIFTVCGQDCPGFFSRIAGVFTLNNIDVLSAQIYTWPGEIALDVFVVKRPADQIYEEEGWNRLGEQLSLSFTDELDVREAVSKKMANNRSREMNTLRVPDKVVVDNKSSSFFTIVEVFAYDYPGLLFKIADAIFRSEVSIFVAKISTKVDQVVDVFYIKDLDDEKVEDPAHLNRIRENIERVIDAVD